MREAVSLVPPCPSPGSGGPSQQDSLDSNRLGLQGCAPEIIHLLGGPVGLQAGAEGHLGPDQLWQWQLLLFSLPLLLLILQKLAWRQKGQVEP